MVSLFGDRSSAPKLKPSRSDSSASSFPAASEPSGVEYISDESHLRDEVEDPLEAPDLRELNNSLEALAVVFPDVQVEVFREMLASFEGESRLALVADALLKNRVQWVKGRWRTAEGNANAAPGNPKNTRSQSGAKSAPAQGNTETPSSAAEAGLGIATDSRQGSRLVPPTEVFRSTSYKKAVRALALQEFRGLPKSTINAVLAEFNHTYLDARRTLVQLSTKSWRFAISSIFLRRKAVVSTTEAENHPLVVWRSSGRGSIVPTIRSTGCSELDRELFDALVRPLLEKARREREERDRSLALYLNNEEAAEMDATHECACCFTDGAFEEFTSCSVEGHMLCFKCIQSSLSEAVFGQGWHNVDPLTGTLKCAAVDGDECVGRINADHLQRAILDLPNGPEVLQKLDDRLAEHCIVKADLPLVRCPFCDYAEIDDIFLPRTEYPLRVRVDSVYNLVFIILCMGAIPFIIPVILVSTFVCLVLSTKASAGPYVAREWSLAIARHHRRRRGQRFRCQNPRCLKDSCLNCQKCWSDIHVCNESSLVSLRTQVEQAMSLAIKRVCPRCNTSFVKNQGCNKLTCPCGYKMCYVCRRDIGVEGYRHFCDHFRPDGDPRPCSECNRCNLWESEDTERLLKKAREEAERNWRENEKRELSGAERTFLETGFLNRRGRGVIGLVKYGVPRLGEVFDLVVETVFY